MPNINRIRVNNVKYNFGTQGYDDFSMRMYGKNTLYDLANGGGKSVLMLLLLQNLIPNCTLDDKQPIEKLFRNGGGNTTIHSLVEWRLDDKDIREGMRYMTTGFCARKAKDADSSEGTMSLPDEVMNSASPVPSEGVGDLMSASDQGAGSAGKTQGKSVVRENASIEYFNYCIFYRDYHQNDIINLPLQNNKERITYSGLKNYLKDLARRNLNIKVYVFERKGEYQRFISRYGLFESQWEIIRGINKTEGHVRTYFETMYKTTRKVVEDLLIEEIIEKAFLVKTEQNDVNEDMARTLLDIKDKLVELSKKKKDIANYDKETELMHMLEGRVSSFLSYCEEKDKVTGTLADIYVTGEHLLKWGQEEIAKRKSRRQEYEKRLLRERRRLEELKIIRDQYELKEASDALTAVAKTVAKAEAETKDARKDLELKESINDYIQYLKDKEEIAENQAVIEAAGKGDIDLLGNLHLYAYNKMRMNEEKLKSVTAALRSKKKDLDRVTKELEKATRVREEGEIALAVAKSHKERYYDEYIKCMEDIRKVRQGIALLVITDTKDLMKDLLGEEEDIVKQLKEAEEGYNDDMSAINDKSKSLFIAKEMKKQLEKDMEAANANLEHYLDNKDRLHKMFQIYEVKNAEDLYDTIKKRAFNNSIELSKLDEKIRKIKKHLKEVGEGRILEESDGIAKVKDYMESRHGEFVLSGVDYLSALPAANREDMLGRFPLLPYGIVTKEFERVKEDVKISELDLGSQYVPVFDQRVIESPYIPEQAEGMLLLSKDKKVFVEEDALKAELEHLQKELSELQEERDHLSMHGETYNEDMDYAATLQGADLENAEAEITRLKESMLDNSREIESLTKEINELQAHIEVRRQETDKAKELMALNKKEQIKIAGIIAKCDQSDELKEKLDFYEAEVRRLEAATIDADSKNENIRLKELDLKGQVAHYEQQINEAKEEWDKVYKDYYVKGDFKDIDISENQLRAEFMAAKAMYEEATITLEDKKKLIATLRTSMERGRKLIERRGIELEQLEEIRKEGELHPTKEDYLNKLSSYLSQLSVRSDQLRDEEKKKEHEVTRIEGRIEQAIAALKEKYGADAGDDLNIAGGDNADSGNTENADKKEDASKERRPAIVTKHEAMQALSEGNRVVKGLVAEIQKFDEEYKKYIKDHENIIDLYKDIKRIVASEEIDVRDAHVLTGNRAAVREAFEESLLAYDKSNKTLAKTKQELLNFKTQTANTFFAMGAFELSAAIKDDVVIPETYEDAKSLLNNIREMISYIVLEKERVEKGIEDMETIKNNFENQCIERCKDVKTELEKLPKLSRIQLDGEMIQMVNLTIPYVKDEFIKQRMSDYIDEEVAGADRFENNNDRIKYMKNMLLLKKLFGVMVTDMNAIKLKLYKRERIKDQSRYLRYEEAVGSTGQSQGIYIQFLVSIINYISGMYAPEAEASDLKKVIFIDNPFGAAKDIYIWEPIFALLATNNVQLIVPARGATPAITNRFDVNYILGQQLVGGRQQTVVVDYRSQVEANEMEYENLEYSQGTFDFL